MLVALQLLGEAVVPANVTVLLPCVEPKKVPVIVTEVPTSPMFGDKAVIVGGFTPPTLRKVDGEFSLLYSAARMRP